MNYCHAASGYPVWDTWLKEIEDGNDESWTWLTYNNAVKYYSSVDKTIKGHMVQTCHNFRSTKPKKKESEANRIKKKSQEQATAQKER